IHRLKRLYKVGLTVRVESSGDKESLGEEASKQGWRINAIDADEDITLVSAADNEMFDVDVLGGEDFFVVRQNENVVEEVVDAAQGWRINAIDADEDITLVSAADNEMFDVDVLGGEDFFVVRQNENVVEEVVDAAQGKGIMIEEPVKPKKKDQIRLDEEAAKKLQAEFYEEERLAREKDEKEERANIALIEEWDDIQAKINVNHQLAEKLQAQEQEELSDVEKAILFQQLLEKRRKHFAAKRAKEKETNHQQKLNSER
nr:hypothetical protein [Tanacetum cinerariifolium]